MIKTITRTLTPKEKKEIRQSKLSDMWWNFENFTTSFIIIAMVLFTIFSYIKVYFKLIGNVELLFVIFTVVSSLILNLVFHYYLLKDFPLAKKTPIKDIKAEVTIIQSKRAIEREDPEDFGPSFYLEIKEGITTKTIFLWGQYLYCAKVPNTYIEITRRNDTKEILDIKTKGIYFPPEKTIPSFSDADWIADTFHKDGEIINLSLEEIT